MVDKKNKSAKKASEKPAKKVQEKKTDVKKHAAEKAHEKKEHKVAEKKGEVKEKKVVQKDALLFGDKKTALSGYKTVVHPLITEKNVNLIDAENKLVFIVAKNSTKTEIKKAVEGLYGVKVDKVNVVIDSKSRKKAFVKIAKEFKAGEIATKLGVL